MQQIYDVLIIGAGVSGIGMASRLAMHCPEKSVAILERRSRIGGTWDLFRYPGIRSDSDMYTFGFNFRPWSSFKTLADGPSIRSYLAETADEYGIQNKIHYNLKSESAEWDSAAQCWTIHTTNEETGNTKIYHGRFLVAATGYYNYDAGYRPDFPGEEQYQGQVVHPQHWPEDLDYKGKKVVVIGSGATAITLVPSMAQDAAHVTMLQRSPTYIATIPAVDKVSAWLSRVLPKSLNYTLARRRNVFLWRSMYRLSRRFPNATKNLLLKLARKQVGEGYQEQDFTPRYAPWDQRLCAAPDGDFFATLKSGKASIVTDTIKSFSKTGVVLNSGKELEADIIITATGLNVQMLGGMQIRVDGEAQDLSQKMMYKGALIEDVPNMAWVIGYVNLSWTMKADLTSEYVCRLIRHMDQHDIGVARPIDHGSNRCDSSILDALESGYVQRADHTLPRQGRSAPWEVKHVYEEDRRVMLGDNIDDDVLTFEPRGSRVPDADITEQPQAA